MFILLLLLIILICSLWNLFFSVCPHLPICMWDTIFPLCYSFSLSTDPLFFLLLNDSNTLSCDSLHILNVIVYYIIFFPFPIVVSSFLLSHTLPSLKSIYLLNEVLIPTVLAELCFTSHPSSYAVMSELWKANGAKALGCELLLALGIKDIRLQ